MSPTRWDSGEEEYHSLWYCDICGNGPWILETHPICLSCGHIRNNCCRHERVFQPPLALINQTFHEGFRATDRSTVITGQSLQGQTEPVIREWHMLPQIISTAAATTEPGLNTGAFGMLAPLETSQQRSNSGVAAAAADPANITQGMDFTPDAAGIPSASSARSRTIFSDPLPAPPQQPSTATGEQHHQQQQQPRAQGAATTISHGKDHRERPRGFVGISDQETNTRLYGDGLSLRNVLRLSPTTGCGEAMYADIQESEEGGSLRLEQELRKDAAIAAAMRSRPGAATPNNNPQASGQAVASNPTSGSTVASGSVTIAPAHASSGPSSAAPAAPVPSVAGTGNSPGPTATRQFLLLCVNGPSHKRWSNVELPPDLNDKALFDAVRVEYAKLRMSYTRSFDHIASPGVIRKIMQKMVLLGDRCWNIVQVFFVPQWADFVKFQVVPIKNFTVPLVQQTPCLPPQAEVDAGNYHYHPCPPDVDSPCLRIAYLHSLLDPGGTGAHQYRFWALRTPKKRMEALRYQDDRVDAVGYGVHVVEGVNHLALAALVAALLMSSLVLGLAYSLRAGDVSRAFTVASFVLAAEALVVTLVTTVLVASLSNPG